LVAGAGGAAEVGSEAAVAALAEAPVVAAGVHLAGVADPAVEVGSVEAVGDSEVVEAASAAVVVEPSAGHAIAPR
jgi:hypothetical protein